VKRIRCGLQNGRSANKIEPDRLATDCLATEKKKTLLQPGVMQKSAVDGKGRLSREKNYHNAAQY